MSPFLKKIFMLRRRDLIRWGRASAILFIITGISCLIAAVVLGNFINGRLATSLNKATEQLIDSAGDRVPEEGAKALREGNADLISAFKVIAISAVILLGLLALYAGLLSWRAYELAGENPGEGPESAQGP